MSKRELQAGDRVRVYDATKFNWPVKGTVARTSPALIIKGNWGEYKFYPQQCRRLVKKPSSEKGGTEIYPWQVVATRVAMAGQRHGLSVDGKTAYFLKPGEVILDRAKLAEAWDHVFDHAIYEKASRSLGFASFCRALGIDAALKGEK